MVVFRIWKNFKVKWLHQSKTKELLRSLKARKRVLEYQQTRDLHHPLELIHLTQQNLCLLNHAMAERLITDLKTVVRKKGFEANSSKPANLERGSHKKLNQNPSNDSLIICNLSNSSGPSVYIHWFCCGKKSLTLTDQCTCYILYKSTSVFFPVTFLKLWSLVKLKKLWRVVSLITKVAWVI